MSGPIAVNLTVRRERWPIAGTFAISRGSKTEAEVVVAELFEADRRGRGECVPYGRYGETVEDVIAALEAQAARLAAGLTRDILLQAMRPGAARNALDCALWDLEAKRRGISAFALAGIAAPHPVTTAYTISLDEPARMADAAARARARPLIKVKLGGDGDGARIAAVRRAAPDAQLIVDANEGWRADTLAENFSACHAAGVTMIEQPLPAGADDALARIKAPMTLCADESVHGLESLGALAGKYGMVNIKLDKAGGLTAALALADAARAQGFAIMVGSMVGTSLAMAPALVLAQRAAIVDLDGPLLLARDRPHGLRYDGSVVHPPERELWG